MLLHMRSVALRRLNQNLNSAILPISVMNKCNYMNNCIYMNNHQSQNRLRSYSSISNDKLNAVHPFSKVLGVFGKKALSSQVTASMSTSSSSDAAMQDEYGEMTSDGESYVHPEPFPLECGVQLQEATLRYQTYGALNEARDNAVVVCHALTG